MERKTDGFVTWVFILIIITTELVWRVHRDLFTPTCLILANLLRRMNTPRTRDTISDNGNNTISDNDDTTISDNGNDSIDNDGNGITELTLDAMEVHKPRKSHKWVYDKRSGHFTLMKQ